MSEKELREKYGGKLPKALNRAIRAELPDGNAALDTLTQLAGPAMQSGWKTHDGNPTPEAVAYFRQKKLVEQLEGKVRMKYGIYTPPPKPKKTKPGEAPKHGKPRSRK